MNHIIFFYNGEEVLSLNISNVSHIIPREGEEVIINGTKKKILTVKSVCYNYAIKTIIIDLK